MSISKKYLSLFEAILCSFAFMVFSFFIQYELPFRLLSFSALLLPAFYFSRNFKTLSDLRLISIKSASLKITIIFCLVGLLLGVLLAIFYRWHQEISLFPKSFHLFVFVAALIGCTEELVFRGFIQDYVKSINALSSILFSTISHTAYKCCLFLSPLAAADINIGFLVLWTVIAGILFGSIKHISGSLLPALIAHALFDILVYAEHVSAPWWVW